MKLAAITCLFGLRDDARRLENYQTCATMLRSQGIDLWTVEGLLPGQSSRTNDDRTIRIGCLDLLWHKERLLQLGVERLPEPIDAVLWIDADVVFDWPTIRDRIEHCLTRYRICQPWSDAIYLDERQQPLNGPIDVTKIRAVDLARWMREVPQFLTRSAAAENCDEHSYTRAHTGLAWAARRDWFSEVGLYEYALGGNGDETLAEGCWGVIDATARGNYSAAHWAHVLHWIAKCYDAVRGQVGYVPGVIRHLWHGEIRQRGYRERELSLVAGGFDPTRHVRWNDNRTLVWSREAPSQLVLWWQRYLGHGDEHAD